MQKYKIRHDKNESGNRMLGDGKFALGMTIGAIVAFLALLALGLNQKSVEANKFIQLAPIIISLLVAMISTYFATNALLEQRRTREASTDPVLIAHLGQREDARELVTFNISNIGAGAALNVNFDAERPCEEVENRKLIQNIFREHHPFAVIPQGKSVEFNLAMGWEILGDKPLPPFKTKILYEDLAGGQYESEFTVDVREMEGLGSNKTPTMRAVTALEKIAKNL